MSTLLTHLCNEPPRGKPRGILSVVLLEPRQAYKQVCVGVLNQILQDKMSLLLRAMLTPTMLARPHLISVALSLVLRKLLKTSVFRDVFNVKAGEG
jgi:hypothetical protein